MGISKFNRKGIDWKVDTKDWGIKKLRELEKGKVYPLKGFFTTPNKGFGEGAILISDGYLVGIPGRYKDLITEMCEDPETVADVMNGKCGFRYDTFMSEQFHREGFTVEFVEL